MEESPGTGFPLSEKQSEVWRYQNREEKGGSKHALFFKEESQFQSLEKAGGRDGLEFGFLLQDKTMICSFIGNQSGIPS